VIAIDAAERIQFANPSARQLLETRGKDAVGRPVWEAVRHSGIQEIVRTIFNGPRQQSAELQLPRKNVTLSLVATRLPGNPCPGAVLVFHDVTELRRLENLRREFVSNVSHELKTPLTAIRAYTETLLEGAIDDGEHNRRFVARIDEQAHRLHVLILDLLQIARLEAEQDVFDIHAVAVKEVIQLCLEQQQALAESKEVVLTAEVPGAQLHVMADEEGLLQILNNLVNNALNYTPLGGRVIVHCGASSAGVRIQVEDTGCGIPEEHLPRIFERFYRVDKARSRELGGTGLGLSIVKHLVQVFGGTIEVHSQLGKGSVFSVELPS
jgi:two-component system phosphate regulon sensor histidine kinase PhoR